MKSDRSKDRVVYSTRKEEPVQEEKREPAATPALPSGLVARVQREKAHRAGRWVTVVYDLQLPDADLERICAQIKKRCATGGTVKDGRLEIQGDHAVKILAELSGLGIRAKRSGA